MSAERKKGKKMVKPRNVKSKETMEFSRTDMANDVLENLQKNGYVVKSSGWNEAGTKFTVETEKKGGK